MEDSLKKLISDPVTEFKEIKSGASERKIYRLYFKTGTVIGVYGKNISENKAFISFNESFRKAGFNVPEIINVSGDNKAYLLDDLGDITVYSAVDNYFSEHRYNEITEIYIKIIENLVMMQKKLTSELDYSLCYQYQFFNRENIEYDIQRFEEYFLGNRGKDLKIYSRFKEELLYTAGNIPGNYFMYRDFQTRNFMIKDDLLYFLDFQSARKGPAEYDLASFLYSSGTRLIDNMEETLLNHYKCFAEKSELNIDRNYRTNVKLMGIIRLMQAIGVYYYLKKEKNNNMFLYKTEKALINMNKLCIDLNMEHGIKCDELYT